MNRAVGPFYEQGPFLVLSDGAPPGGPNGGWFTDFYKTTTASFPPKTFGFMGQKSKPNGGEKEGTRKKDQKGDQQDPGEVARSRRVPRSCSPMGEIGLGLYPGWNFSFGFTCHFYGRVS